MTTLHLLRRRCAHTLARGLVAVLALAGAASVWAHDLWLEPTRFEAPVGAAVGMRIRIGQQLVGEPIALVDGMVVEFVVNDGRPPRALDIQRVADTVASLRLQSPGLQVVGYHGAPSYLELPAEKFNAYLVDEGLENILAMREKRGQSAAMSREMYSRCAKSLLSAGPPLPGQQDRVLGFPLELVAEFNPYAWSGAAAVPVRLLFEGKPLAGALVVAINSLKPAEQQALRSDAEGRVRLQLHEGGHWLVKAVNMVPVPGGDPADWHSRWASLSFEVHRQRAVP